MWDVLSMPNVQAVLGIMVLCILIAVGFWLVASFRDNAAKDVLDPEELLANFEEMHREGDISGTEFRTIKASVTRSRGVVSGSNDEAV
jgi:uncharacterized membrane protein